MKLSLCVAVLGAAVDVMLDECLRDCSSGCCAREGVIVVAVGGAADGLLATSCLQEVFSATGRGSIKLSFCFAVLGAAVNVAVFCEVFHQ